MTLIAGLALLSALSFAQSEPKPNFAGTWVPLEGVNPAVDLVVTQSNTLLAAKAGNEEGHGLEYRLDGVETQQKEGPVKSQAQWDGARLVVVNRFMNGTTVTRTQRQFWSLDASGRLVIETIRERDGQSSTTTSIYKRR